jgi:DNA sulfur modification protein DndD
MVINSISLENFQCYYGQASKNCFKFREGLNIIIGDNGAGKSKIYDGFYWVLFDRVFDSSNRTFLKTSEVKRDLISDKAKFETKEGSYIKAEVIIEIVKRDITYRLCRSYKAKKLSSEDYSKDESWQEPLDSHLQIFKIDVIEPHLITNDDEIETIIQNILPANIQPYLWFQGEQVDSLIDFKDKNTLSKAINILSDISLYDDYVDIAQKSLKSAQYALSQEQRKNTKDVKEREELESNKRSLGILINRQKEELQLAKDEFVIASEKYDELTGKIQDVEALSKLKEKKAQKEFLFRKVNKDKLELKQNFNKNLFSKAWVLRNTLPLFEGYIKNYVNYEEWRLKRVAEERGKQIAAKKITEILQNRLPSNVPEPMYIERMLKEERCLVCDREAKIGSAPYEAIEALLKSSSKSDNSIIEEPISKQDFSNDYKKLSSNGSSYEQFIKRIDKDINDELKKITEFENEEEDIRKELDEIESKLGLLLHTGTIKLEETEDISLAFRNHERKKREKDSTIKDIKTKIELNEKEIVRIEVKLKQLVTGEMNSIFERNVELLKQFEIIVESTKERVSDKLIRRLEFEANRLFQAMTKGNIAVRGKIILEKQANNSYLPRNVGSDGNELSSINDSNIILIKLATIMSIISAKGRYSELYPLISDAPTSKFGETYAFGFFKTISEIYGQSIIMTKELVNNNGLKEKMINEIENIGAIYLIRPNIKEEDREDRKELEIKIKKEK